MLEITTETLKTEKVKKHLEVIANNYNKKEDFTNFVITSCCKPAWYKTKEDISYLSKLIHSAWNSSKKEVKDLDT